MAHIPVQQGLPGVTGLLEYRLDSAKPIRELTQVLMRGESTLTFAERELIATYVSFLNECTFCTRAHEATANVLFENTTIVDSVKWNVNSAPISEKLKSLLIIAQKTQISGRTVSIEDISLAKSHGATDLEIHDTVLISSLFCLYNRYVDGLASWTPEDSGFYQKLADRLVNHGYMGTTAPVKHKE
jgi:uncharacterized peroxidase-related enzyme